MHNQHTGEFLSISFFSFLLFLSSLSFSPSLPSPIPSCFCLLFLSPPFSPSKHLLLASTSLLLFYGGVNKRWGGGPEEGLSPENTASLVSPSVFHCTKNHTYPPFLMQRLIISRHRLQHLFSPPIVSNNRLNVPLSSRRELVHFPKV